ncbi:MAG: thiamine-phosphate kinase [Desulfosarcinaceae bacterium]|jgi:thiamine-monophosphate kinase
MHPEPLRQALRFYFVTDDAAADPLDQVRCAIAGGATLVQFRQKDFASTDFPLAREILSLCRANRVPFVVNDHLLLAKALGADGVHLGQDDESPAVAREVLGIQAIVGVSVSTRQELARTDLAPCDYIGTGPVYATGTKTDTKAVVGLAGLREMVARVSLPVVAIGGIGPSRAKDCFDHGAAGVAVISTISRAAHRRAAAREMGKACGVPGRQGLQSPWNDEFGLIRRIVATGSRGKTREILVDGPGDDTCLLRPLHRPVVTTDCHREGVHFRRDWQALPEVGFKAVVVTLSDLAAAYARPGALFVNLTLPPDLAEDDVVAIYQGIGEALEIYDTALGGGNVSRGPELALDLFAVGEGRTDIMPTRRAARVGDHLYVTGPLGLARAGLHCLKAGDDRFPELVTAFKRPRARFDAAEVLAEAGIPCAMDISDGLAGDARHIAEASELSIDLELSAESLAPALVDCCRRHGLEPLAFAYSGGEDYELLFACPPETFAAIAPRLPGAVEVGRCLPRARAPLVGPAARMVSFQHGSGL